MRISIVAAALAVALPVQAQGPVRFNRDIRPILSDNCFLCHGPDSARRKAGLRLDTEDGMFGPRDEGAAVVKGDPKKSPLLTRISSADPHEMMPPPKSNKTLTAAQKEMFRRWIAEGAPFENHWSFVKPVRPLTPTVKNKEWVKAPLDAFILAKLESLGLTPQPQSDRRALIRRVSLDLIGLPPTPAEVDAFLADQSPNAYEKLVDRLLASDHYGEHRARYWLDAARYGDTHGLHFDNYREMWPYRDWVIGAFNRNLPFDRFTVEQLAGDLLPNRTPDQLIASGFNRCNITTNEGGSINEEVFVSYTRDRVETTSTVFLGLTAGCCQCHNHKFDPLSQKEFYQLAAYFRTTSQAPMDGNIPNTPPVVVVPQAADKDRYEHLQKRAAALEAEGKKQKEAGQKAFEKWLADGLARTLDEPLDPASETFQVLLGNASTGRVFGKGFEVELPKGAARAAGPVAESKGARFSEVQGIEIPGAGDFAHDQPFSMSAWVFVPAAAGNYTIASKTEADGPNKGRGWRLTLANTTVALTLSGSKGESLVRNSANITLGKWAHMVIAYDGSREPNGVTFYFNGKRADSPKASSKTPITTSIANAAPMRLGFDFKGGGVADVRFFDREIHPDEAAILASWLDVERERAKDAAKIDAKWSPSLSALYFTRVALPQLAAERYRVDNEIEAIKRRSPITHVMNDKPGAMPSARVLFRGQYDQPRDEVKAGVFAVLNPLPKDAPNNRLGLAQWIVAPDNPLTARVAVNRFWQEVFGVGLVKTSEDFGSQGESPTHPELLDWLAVEFRESGWDVKRFFKMLVTSSAYKQAAVTTPEARSKDAHNRFLSRGPRFRMDGEMIRDQALAASGLLVRKLGGASVKPYQPDGVWDTVGILGASNTRDYKRDPGEGLYRRSVYWFWKRMSPPASLEIFNAPSRETCSVRRERTNTPLQALVTMNDPQYVEASRHLAQFALLMKEQNDDARLDAIAQRLMARPFRDKERAIVRASLADFAAFYKTNPKEAAKLIAVGDSPANASLDVPTLAAWTMVANQLMNLDEVLNK